MSLPGSYFDLNASQVVWIPSFSVKGNLRGAARANTDPALNGEVVHIKLNVSRLGSDGYPVVIGEYVVADVTTTTGPDGGSGYFEVHDIGDGAGKMGQGTYGNIICYYDGNTSKDLGPSNSWGMAIIRRDSSLVIPTSTPTNNEVDLKWIMDMKGLAKQKAMGWTLQSDAGNPGPAIVLVRMDLDIEVNFFLDPGESTGFDGISWIDPFSYGLKLGFTNPGTYRFTLRTNSYGIMLYEEWFGKTIDDTLEFSVDVTPGGDAIYGLLDIHGLLNGQEVQGGYLGIGIQPNQCYPQGPAYIGILPLKYAWNPSTFNKLCHGINNHLSSYSLRYWSLNDGQGSFVDVPWDAVGMAPEVGKRKSIYLSLPSPLTPTRVQVRVFDGTTLLDSMLCDLTIHAPRKIPETYLSINTNQWTAISVRKDQWIPSEVWNFFIGPSASGVTATITYHGKQYSKTVSPHVVENHLVDRIPLGADTTIDIDVSQTPPPPGKGSLEVHAFEDGSEVAASVDIVGIGSRSTPFTESLDAGSYDLSVTFKGVTKTDTVVIVASETTRTEYSFTAAPSDGFPFKNLARFPRLYKFVYGIWLKRKGKGT